MAKDTIFGTNFSINCGGILMELDYTKVMGILNVTPDSFFDGGKHNSIDDALRHTESLINDGADIIDIGAFSTRPGAETVSLEEELKRIVPIVEAINKQFPEAILSIDTFRSEVAKQTIQAGAHIINDISGGTMDSNMFKTIAELQVPYILMHILGTPETMQNSPSYKNVTQEVLFDLGKKINELRSLGVNDIIVDPGFGFGKTIDHNYELMKNMDLFHSLNAPLLIGISRKSMIWKPLNSSPQKSLNGTTVLNSWSIQKGAHFLRVHDVKEAKETVELYKLILNA